MKATKLPSSALLDSGVLIRALGERSEEPQSANCLRLLRDMEEANRRIYVAAPTIAEIERNQTQGPPPSLPISRNIVVVPFDREAARLLALHFPWEVIKGESDEQVRSRRCIKYDAMIVACALRIKAASLVSLDAGMRKLCAQAKLKAGAPSAYVCGQQSLAFLPQSNS